MFSWPLLKCLKRRTPAAVLVAVLAAAGMLTVSTPVMAQPISSMGALPTGGGLPANTHIIDLRPQDACLRGSLPAARCLPAHSLLGRTGEPVSFHALRWLLGTVGLNGTETVIVYVGGSESISDDDLDDAWTIAALLYLAGQKRVIVYNGLTPDTLSPGTARSFSRETIYTAAMRDRTIMLGKSDEPLRRQLITFAQTGGASAVTLAPDS